MPKRAKKSAGRKEQQQASEHVSKTRAAASSSKVGECPQMDVVHDPHPSMTDLSDGNLSTADRAEQHPGEPWISLAARELDRLFHCWEIVLEALPIALFYVKTVIITYRGRHLIFLLSHLWRQGGQVYL